MNQKNLSRWLKCIITVTGLCGATIYGVIIPLYGEHLKTLYPELSNCFIPWLIFLWISGIPCFTVLVLSWKIAGSIEKDRAFSNRNARLLKWISLLSAGDSCFFFIGNVVLFLLSMSHPAVLLALFAVIFAGVAFAVTAAVLSHLVKKAAILQEQSDLTI